MTKKQQSKPDDFNREIQVKRIEKGTVYTEIRLLDTFPSSYHISWRETPFGMVVSAELSKQLFTLSSIRLPNITFEVHLEGSYPFSPPTLCCMTHFTEPSISDGRDLLQHVIGSGWSPSFTISSIVGELPALVKTCVSLGSRCALEFGTYHEDAAMSLNTWDGRDTMGFFNCSQVLNEKSVVKRALVVTETAILVLEPNSKYLGIGKLVSWASLRSLMNIRRPKNAAGKLTFQWKGDSDDDDGYTQVFIMKDFGYCIELISSNVNRLGVLMSQETIGVAPTLHEEDVTKKALRKIRINDVLQAIAVYEANLQDTVTTEMVSSLMGLYQQAIEYFSAVGDPRYDEFLDRMHYLLSNDEVTAVLSSDGKEEIVKTKEEVKIEDRLVTRGERSPLKKEILTDLVLETPLIETLTPPPVQLNIPKQELLIDTGPVEESLKSASVEESKSPEPIHTSDLDGNTGFSIKDRETVSEEPEKRDADQSQSGVDS